MTLFLLRTAVSGNATIGRLFIDNTAFCDTLERTDRQIPEGQYPVRITFSPRFGEQLPLVEQVPHRAGIRIHAGNTTADSTGCILVGEANSPRTLTRSRLALNRLRDRIDDADHCTLAISSAVVPDVAVAPNKGDGDSQDNKTTQNYDTQQEYA